MQRRYREQVAPTAGRPRPDDGLGEARPVTREELQRSLDCADEQVERAVGSGRKGALAAYRDATIFKVIYGWDTPAGVRES